MGIKSTWDTIESILTARGIPLMDAGDVPQPRRCTIRIVEIPSDQSARGAICSGVIRLLWRFEIAMSYDASTDKRVERKVAEDAEDIIAAIYGSTSMPKGTQFSSANIERNVTQGWVTNTMRFDVQDQAAL